MPEIPGEGLRAVGQGLLNLAGGLGRLNRSINAQAQAFEKAEQYKELTQAKQLANDRIDRFNLLLDPFNQQQPDSTEYLKLWQEERIKIHDDVADLLKLPDARRQFDEWWLVTQAKQQRDVIDAARDRLVGEIEVSYTETVQSLVRQGKPDEVQAQIREAAAAGVITGDQARADINQNVPLANYNRIQQYLLKSDLDTALNMLASPEFGEKAGLTPDQVQKMTREFQFRKNNIDNASRQQLEEQQRAAFEEFVQKTANVTDMAKLSREDLTSYLLRVGEKYRDDVQRFIDKLDKSREQAAKDQAELQQDVQYSQLSAQMLQWDYSGTPPWSLDDLNGWVANGTITEAQRDKLEVDYRTAQQNAEKGIDKTQHQSASVFMGRLYSALDELKDPGVAVSIRELDEARDLDRISPDQYDQLIARRQSLREDYQRRLKADKKAKGPQHEDPEKVAALWATVLDPKLSATEKYQRARPLLFNGVPGEKWYQITNHIDELNNRPDWKSRMDALEKFYSAVIGAINKQDDERKVASLERANAAQAMLQIFREYPDAPGKWDEALQSLLDPVSKRELQQMLQSKLEATFGFRLFGRPPEWMMLETAREQLGAAFGPALQMQQAIKTPEIIQQEKKILEKERHKIVDQYQLPDGVVYATEPIPRDENGIATAADLRRMKREGKLFGVVSVVRNGRIEQEVR